MEKSIFLAGSGGDGIQVAGKTLVLAANTDTVNATYSPRYGVEKRGGLSSCYLIISDRPIGNPRKQQSDLVVMMEQKACEKFPDCVAPGGTLIVNSSLIGEVPELRNGRRSIGLPLSGIANELGDARVISSLLLGLVTGMPELALDAERVGAQMNKTLSKKPELLKLNNIAFERGLQLAEQSLAGR